MHHARWFPMFLDAAAFHQARRKPRRHFFHGPGTMTMLTTTKPRPLTIPLLLFSILLIFLTGLPASAQIWRSNLQSKLQRLIAADDADRADAEAVLRRIAGYWDNERKKYLTAIAGTLDSTDDKVTSRWNKSATTAQDKVEKIIEYVETARTRAMSSTAAGGDAADEFYRYALSVLAMDMALYGEIAKSKIANLRDELKARHNALITKTEELTREWEGHFVRSDNQIDSKINTAVNQYRDMIDSVVKEEVKLRGAMSRPGNAVIKWLSEHPKADWIVKTGSPIATLINGLADVISTGVDTITGATSTTRSKDRAAIDLLRVESSILIVFSNTRKEVEEFVSMHDAGAVAQIASRADKQLDAMIARRSNFIHEDWKQGAEFFKGETSKIISELQKEYEDDYKRFVTKHGGVFFGPIKNDVIEELLEGRTWEEQIDKLNAVGLSKYLNGSYFLNNSLIAELDWNMLRDGRDEARQLIREAISRQLDEWESNVNRFVSTDYRRFLDKLRNDRKQKLDALLRN